MSEEIKRLEATLKFMLDRGKFGYFLKANELQDKLESLIFGDNEIFPSELTQALIRSLENGAKIQKWIYKTFWIKIHKLKRKIRLLKKYEEIFGVDKIENY